MSASLLTTTVGSYPIPDWLAAMPSEQALLDATRVVIDTQRQAGIDLPTDGELYRFDINHPDTNGMIDYFVRKLGGVSQEIGRSASEAFRAKTGFAWRAKPAGIVKGPITEGSLNLLEDCRRAASVAGGDFKFTVTSPYMLARTLLDEHYGSLGELTMAIAEVLAQQVRDLPCACIQIDEANVPGSPADGPIASLAINRVLEACGQKTAVHLCFGNYGGQSIQSGTWDRLLEFLNSLSVDHFLLELAHRPASDLDALTGLDSRFGVGLGVVDIKVNHIETPDEIARRIEAAANTLGAHRLRYIHPDCGFWMLKRSVADRKIAALAQGRDRFLGS